MAQQEERLQSLQQSAPKGLQEKVQEASMSVEGARKPVTILFADIVGSTTIAEKLDPEEWREVISGVHLRVGEAVYRYEGTIAQLLGDGVLAFFGAPITHEDDPIRAVRTGLDIQSSIAEYAHSLAGYVDDLQLRVGIHTGEVVIGSVGTDMHLEYLAIGDAVNIAARLESAAEPGSILISAQCARMIGDDFEVRDLGKIALKGKTKALHVFEVLKARGIPALRRGLMAAGVPYVGRTQEVAALQSCVQALCAGQGGIVTLMGEAGIGKTRLLEEVRDRIIRGDQTSDEACLPAASIRWLEGRALSYGGSLSYWTITQLLLDDLGLSDGAPELKIKVALRKRLGELQGRAAEPAVYLGHLLGLSQDQKDQDLIEAVEAEEVKRRTHTALNDYFFRVAQLQPTVLVLEDMHWSDPSSIEVIGELMTLSDRTPLLIIILMRVERDHGSWQLKQIAETDFPHRYTGIELNRLSDGHADELMDHLLGKGAFPERIKRLIRERSEGNPFYLEEVAYHLVENGLIEQVDGQWRVTGAIEETVIPETLQGVLLARIDRLEEDVRRTLQLASVIGKSFLYRLLEAISEAEQELDQHLSQLQRVDLVREKSRLPELEYIFKHTLTQEAAYNSLLQERRKEFHLKVGQAIETLFPERREEFLGLLAHHFEAAGSNEKTRDYLLKAGDQARLAFANQEAIEFYRRALPVLHALGDEETAVRAMMKLGLTCHNAFQFEAAREAYDQAFYLGRKLGQTKTRPSELSSPHPLRFESPDVPSLDPAHGIDTTSFLVIQQLFRGLLKMDLEMNVRPDVAQHWEVLEGGKKYVFHLRDDVKWSDGERVKAGDFEFAWKRILDPETRSTVAVYLYDIRNARAYHQGEISDPSRVGISTVDDRTLIVKLEEPCSYFLYLLTLCITSPLPKHILRKNPVDWSAPESIIGNGPFLLEKLQPGKELILVRNPDYYGEVLGNVQRVEIKLDFDKITSLKSLERYQRDEMDVLYLPALSIREAQSHYRAFSEEIISVPDLVTFYLGFNVRHPPFDDRRVRKAFALSLDKKFIVDVILEGANFPATGGFIPLGMLAHSKDIGLPFAPDQARELFKEAGHTRAGDFPRVEAVVGSLDRATQMSDYTRTQWRDILGVEVSWVEEPWPDFLKRMHQSPPSIYGLSWMSDYPDPDNFLRIVAWRSETGWKHDQFASLVDEARRIPDLDQRVSMYREAEKILMDEVPIIPLAYGRSHYLFKPWVNSAPFLSAGPVPNLEDFVISPH